MDSKALATDSVKTEDNVDYEEENNENDYNINNNKIYYKNDLLIARIVYQCVECIHVFNTITDSHNHYKQFHQNINNKSNECLMNENHKNRVKTLRNKNKNLIESNKGLNERKIKSKNVNKKCSTNRLKTNNKIKTNEEIKSSKSYLNSDQNVYECDLCDNSYRILGSFLRHRKLHTNPKSCDFPDCDKRFSTNRELNLHKQTHNKSNVHKFKCNLCPKSFSRLDYLNVHKNIHLNPKVCDYPECGKLFSTNTQLKTHKLIHSEEYPYKCSYDSCNFTAKQPAGLTAHEMTHNKERNYKCSLCLVRLKSPEILKKHIIIRHKNERNYVCEWPGCDKRFSMSCHLNNHRRTHTGEKPYGCDWPNCGQSFGTLSTLKIHRCTHTGERPYHCDWPGCEARFSARGTMDTHKKLVHKCDGIRRSRWDNKNKL